MLTSTLCLLVHAVLVLQVRAAFQALQETVESILAAVNRQLESSGTKSTDKPVLYLIEDSLGVLIKMPASVGDKLQRIDLGTAGAHKLVKARGAAVRSKSVYTCEVLNDRVAAYAGEGRDLGFPC